MWFCSYNFKLRVDQRGEVENSHCECPAGKGPNGLCKHIAAVCLMLCMFKEDGKLSLSLSCTEKLQVFHRPVKKHTGGCIIQFPLNLTVVYVPLSGYSFTFIIIIIIIIIIITQDVSLSLRRNSSLHALHKLLSFAI